MILLQCSTNEPKEKQKSHDARKRRSSRFQLVQLRVSSNPNLLLDSVPCSMNGFFYFQISKVYVSNQHTKTVIFGIGQTWSIQIIPR